MRDREHVLVAAAGEADGDELVLRHARRHAHRMRHRVRGFERGDDALELAEKLERLERILVAGREILHPALVLEPRMLRAYAGIIEAGRDRMRLQDLPVAIL